MRKIISKETEEKKRKKNQFLVGGLLILVMVLSTVGYSFNNQEDNSEKIVYNGVKFIKSDNLWYANVGDFQFSFSYNPAETEEINSTLNFLNKYENLPLYVYSENSEATVEIYRNLFYNNLIVQRMQEACPESEKCEAEIPVKNCSNNFIIIKKSETNEIQQKQNCTFINGKDEELVKLTDE
ncbi:hypothetical protein M0R72_09770, partial [Candidatus Pacearchaeota archaeon]|nr:hypothetical protein [Candidatus Pacearchaeota archaeon]